MTVGATQALLVALIATLDKGSEVILPEPFFDLYVGQVALAGGITKPAPMTVDVDGEWRLSKTLRAHHAQKPCTHSEQPAQPDGQGV